MNVLTERSWFTFFQRAANAFDYAFVFFEMKNGAQFFSPLPTIEYVTEHGFDPRTESNVEYIEIKSIAMGFKFPVRGPNTGFVNPTLVANLLLDINGLLFELKDDYILVQARTD